MDVTDQIENKPQDDQPSKAKRHQRWQRRCLVVASFLALGYVVWCGVLYTVQEHMIFPGAGLPAACTEGPPTSNIEEIWITTPEGWRVEAWFEPGQGCTPERPGPAVMYFHGNCDLIEQRWPISENYVPAGVSFLIMEYRGYGRSSGRPSEQGLITDAVQFYDWLRARPQVDPARIVLHGISLGGGVAVGLAQRRPAAAIVLECTFANVAEFCRRYLTPQFLCRHPFRSDRIIGQLDVPLLIFHGQRDEVIPVEHGRRLHALAPHSVYVETNTGHDDFKSDFPTIISFLVEHGVLNKKS